MRSIKPPPFVLDEIRAGTYVCDFMPYQYVNWAAERLDKEPIYYAGGEMRIGALLDLSEAAWLEWEFPNGI